MSLWLKRLVPAILGLLILIQVFQPSRVNPPIDPSHEMVAHLTVEPAVQSIFDRACNDCHSNRTLWPWYSHVAPISWLVASDVTRGRRRVNFSEWATYAPQASGKLLGEICKEVQDGDMPPLTYTPMHSSAKLTNVDRQDICRWTTRAQQNLTTANVGEKKP